MKKLFHQAKANNLTILVLVALVPVVIHALTNNRYGFQRDELQTLDDARRLAWGYVAYPPVTPFIARVALDVFGPSLVGLRLFSSLAIAVATVLTGLLASELGASLKAQIMAAVATAITPVALIEGSLFQYVSFDYLWWVLSAYLMMRLIRSENPRFWLGIGAVIGIGMLTKYTMGLFVAGIVCGVLGTALRRHLWSPWLWAGVLVSIFLFLPNFVWQVQHQFISLDFIKAIHERDVRIGRTAHNFVDQFVLCANIVTIQLWLTGLWFYFFAAKEGRYRVFGWMYAVPLLLLLLTRGRSYYIAPAYPMLIAGGVASWERLVSGVPLGNSRLRQGLQWVMLVVGGVGFAMVMLPVAPVNSRLWNVTSNVHDNFVEEIGWPELTETVAGLYAALPEAERSHTGILANNYGEAGALDLYGPAYSLPQAISGVNSYWLRGYGNPAPETLIVLGASKEGAERFFASCSVAGHTRNRFGVENEETRDHPDILICRDPQEPWDTLWQKLKRFG